MFDSVTHPKVRGRVGTGALLSVLLHGAALLVAVGLTARSGAPTTPPLTVLKFVHPMPAPAAAPSATPAPAAAPTRPRAARPHPVRATSEAVLGARVEPPDLSAPDATGAPELDLPGTVGAGISAAAPSTVGAGVGTGTGNAPLLFSAEQGMTLPRRIAGADPVYTREALEAGVQGTLIAKCVITAEGAVQGCQILKGLPHLDRAVLEALRAQRYTPVTFQGKPVAVSYLFTFRMVLPAR